MANGSPIYLNTGSSNLMCMMINSNRLSSYNCGWSLDFLTPSQMANAGFYYVGLEDCVRCVFCSTEFSEWKLGDDPLAEHKRRSPYCPFFSITSSFDDGRFDDVPINSNSRNKDVETNLVRNIIASADVVELNKTSEFIEYAMVETRLNSFKKYDLQLKMDFTKLSEAGFFYIGDGKIHMVVCFCCNESLSNWENVDEPWKEHARCSPNCSFLLLSKGREFVDEINEAQENEPKTKQPELQESSESIIDLDNTIEQNIGVQLTHKNVIYIEKSKEKTDAAKITTALSEIAIKKDLSTISDSMLCKICVKEEMQTVLVMCGHIFACTQCVVILDHCAICRKPANMAMQVNMFIHNDKGKDLSQSSETSLKPTFCKICKKSDVQAMILPCKHIYACINCALKSNVCLACSKPYICVMHIYL